MFDYDLLSIIFITFQQIHYYTIKELYMISE